MTSTHIRIALAASALLVSARSANSQQLERSDSASQSPTSPQPDRLPSTRELGLTSIGGATGGALIGGVVGFVIDGQYCQHYHGAALGVAPGVVMMVAPRTGRDPAVRAIFIGGAPVLSGIGAALAVLRCHAS